MFYKCGHKHCSWDDVLYESTPKTIDGFKLRMCPTCGHPAYNYMEFCNASFLIRHPEYIFVFGDNLLRKGKGGAAKLRDEPNTYGFITKRYPDNKDSSFYKPEEYKAIFKKELEKLETFCDKNNDKKILLSKIGAGLANKFNIWEEVIYPNIPRFIESRNIYKLWID